jgi:hypothetical protein
VAEEPPPRVTTRPVAIPPATPATTGIQILRCLSVLCGLTFVSSIEPRTTWTSGENSSLGALIPITTNCPAAKVTSRWLERACSDFLRTYAVFTVVTETVPT